jgi:hypothetical protein
MVPSSGRTLGKPIRDLEVRVTKKPNVQLGPAKGDIPMSLGLILIIILIIFLLGGFSGRFGGYGYGYGHGGVGLIGTILIIILILMLLGKI